MSRSNWNLPAPPGFCGLRDDRPLTRYLRKMPHWRQEGATYFVTFRLADALPQSKLRELRGIRAKWQRKQLCGPTDADWLALSRELTEKIEKWLDVGMGSCLLRGQKAKQTIADSLAYLNDNRVEIGCYVIMPNHVHMIARPVEPVADPLEAILQSHKRHTARHINAIRGTSGSLWQEESYDRIIRDEEHLWNCIQYIGRNAKLANLTANDVRRWIRPDWIERGWRFDATCD